MILQITPTKQMQGVLTVPGDKSISHRAVMLGSIAKGTTEITGFLRGEDCLSTVKCMKSLGVPIKMDEDKVFIEGQGLLGLKEAKDVLDTGNSGTTIRLLSGILAGQSFTSVVNGDASLRNRPMGRIIEPLMMMGTQILGRKGNNYAPFAIRGGNLKPLSYTLPVASAQLKSTLLLAGLYAQGWTEIIEPVQSRNHTEIMLKSFGAHIHKEDNLLRIEGGTPLKGQKIIVPGDVSSAAFFMVAGLIVPEGHIILKNVGLNKTRSGIIDVLQEMGAAISITDTWSIAGELLGTVEVRSSELKGVTVGGGMIPRLIDEIPILAVAALFAQGVTEIRDAAELKVKESNRIAAICQELQRLGARVEELPDGLRIYGGQVLRGTTCNSYHDHRIAMALAVAALRAQGDTYIEGAEAIDISFPSFKAILTTLSKGENHGDQR